MNDPAPTPPGDQRRLDQIETQWSLLRISHEDSVSRAGPARQAMALRYSGAIRSYVGALVGNDHDADEVAQEVVVRILKGDFAQATPERGRFRDLLKVSVKNMVRTFWSRQRRRSGVDLDAQSIGQAAPDDDSSDDSRWRSVWQRSVLNMTWAVLETYQQQTEGSVAHTVLRLRAENPEADSRELARLLSAAIGRDFAPPATRQQLRRARLRFAQLLIEEVARGLAKPTPEGVEEELIDLGLHAYVVDFLPDDWRTRGQLHLASPAGE